MTEEAKQGKKKFSVRVFLEVTLMVATAAYAMYSMYDLNQKNIENTRKVEALIVDLNDRVDQFIASDDEVYNRYISNLQKSLDSLSEEEKELIKSIYDVRAD